MIEHGSAKKKLAKEITAELGEIKEEQHRAKRGEGEGDIKVLYEAEEVKRKILDVAEERQNDLKQEEL